MAVPVREVRAVVLRPGSRGGAGPHTACTGLPSSLPAVDPHPVGSRSRTVYR